MILASSLARVISVNIHSYADIKIIFVTPSRLYMINELFSQSNRMDRLGSSRTQLYIAYVIVNSLSTPTYLNL